MNSGLLKRQRFPEEADTGSDGHHWASVPETTPGHGKVVAWIVKKDLRSSVDDPMPKLHRGGHFDPLAGHLPDACFHVRNERYELVMCDEEALRLFHLKNENELPGRSGSDVCSAKSAAPNHGDDIGVMGISRILRVMEMRPNSFGRHAKALDHIRLHYREPIDIRDLAKLCNLCVSHFRSTFTKKFRMSPRSYILKFRIRIACRQLAHGDLDIASIAMNNGFCDQSYFTRQFRSEMGMTPLKYRERHLDYMGGP